MIKGDCIKHQFFKQSINVYSKKILKSHRIQYARLKIYCTKPKSWYVKPPKRIENKKARKGEKMQFLYTLVILGVAVGLGSILCQGGMRDAVRGALGVVLIAVMIVPFLTAMLRLCDFVTEGGDIRFPVVENDTEAFDEITATAFADGIKEAIKKDFSINGEVAVKVRGFSVTELRADSITVVIESSDLLVDFRAVREYTEKNFTRVGGCEVLYG